MYRMVVGGFCGGIVPDKIQLFSATIYIDRDSKTTVYLFIYLLAD